MSGPVTGTGQGPSPALPDYSIGFGGAVRRGFSRYATFDGRASRAEFWFWYLFVVGGVLVLAVPAGVVVAATASASSDGTPSPLAALGFGLVGLFYLAVLLPTLAVACRRLHDAGFSGLFLLLGLVTGLIPLIMCILPTSPAAVRFGPPGQPYDQPGQPYGQPAQPYGQPGQPYGLPHAGYGPPEYQPQPQVQPGHDEQPRG